MATIRPGTSIHMQHDTFRRALPVAVLGAALAAFGLIILGGWFLQLEDIVRPFPDFLMLPGVAIGFAFAGAALALGAILPAARRRVQTCAGALLAGLGALVLLEHLSGTGPWIDWPRLRAGLEQPEAGRFPAQISAVAGAAFVLAGLVLYLVPRVRPGRTATLVRVLTAAVGAGGALALLAHVLDFPDMFDGHWLALAAPPANAPFLALALALWLDWRNDAWNVSLPDRNRDSRIALAGAVVLMGGIAVTGVCIFSLMQNSLERTLTTNLSVALKTRETLVGGAIERAIRETRDVADRPNVRQLYSVPSRDPDSPNHPAFLRKISDSLLQAGFTAFGFYDPRGRELARSGAFIGSSDLRLPVRLDGQPAEIVWDGHFALQASADIVDGGRRIGAVRGQHSLPEFDRVISQAAALGATSEFAVCAARPNGVHCAPTQLQPRPFDVTLAPGRRLPVSYALDGATGVIKAIDYRGRRVLAAYTPLAGLGIGAVLKIDLAELYAPIRAQLGLFILTLLAVGAAGGWLLHTRVRPLVRSLAQREQQLRLALESSQLAIWDWDLAAGSIHLGEQWSAILGGTPRIIDMSADELFDMVHPDDIAAVREQIRAMLNGTLSHYDIEHRVRNYAGDWKWIRSRGRVVERSALGRALRAIGTNVDIDERKNRELLVTRLAHHDVLTGLPNRSLFRDRLDQALLRSRRAKTLLAVLYIDVDHFKAVNDSFGHAVGDAVLAEFGHRITACTRATDTVARLGGDEFAVVLENLTGRTDGIRIARCIVAAMHPAFVCGEHSAAVSASVGIAFQDGATEISAEALVVAADQALYDAKRAGRNTFRPAS